MHRYGYLQVTICQKSSRKLLQAQNCDKCLELKQSNYETEPSFVGFTTGLTFPPWKADPALELLDQVILEGKAKCRQDHSDHHDTIPASGAPMIRLRIFAPRNSFRRERPATHRRVNTKIKYVLETQCLFKELHVLQCVVITGSICLESIRN